jgi:hypothetical protein
MAARTKQTVPSVNRRVVAQKRARLRYLALLVDDVERVEERGNPRVGAPEGDGQAEEEGEAERAAGPRGHPRQLVAGRGEHAVQHHAPAVVRTRSSGIDHTRRQKMSRQPRAGIYPGAAA